MRGKQEDQFDGKSVMRGKEGKMSDFTWPVFLHQRYNEALLKFMYSFKNVYSENINGYSGGCFITGASKSGKSWFLRYNLRKFQNSKISPLVFYIDLGNQKQLSFGSFLHQFERMIIDTLVDKNKEFALK